MFYSMYLLKVMLAIVFFFTIASLYVLSYFYVPIIAVLIISMIILFPVFLFFAWTAASWFGRRCFRIPLFRAKSENKCVLITGCDSGFGYLTALKLNKLGFRVFAACLFPEGEGALNLVKEGKNPEKLHIIKMNVVNDDDIDKAVNQVKNLMKNGEHLYGIINNAGVLFPGEIEWGKYEHHCKAQLDIDLFGVVKVTRKFLPLIRQGRGRVINVNSIAGRMTGPCLGFYSVAKSGTIVFTEALQRDMRKFGVRVVSIEPCFYGTMLANQSILKESLSRIWKDTPEEIRADYGEDYFQNSLKVIGDYETITRKKVNEVVNTIIEGLVSFDPDPRYIVSSFISRPFLWFVETIPREWHDIGLRFYDWCRSVSKPVPSPNNNISPV